jgi:site-specific recombinase XerD
MTVPIVISKPSIEKNQFDPLEQFLAGQLSENTRRAYHADLGLFFRFLDLDLPDLETLRGITFRQVIAFRNHLASDGFKRTSINRKLSSLKAFFKMLVAAGYIEQNPADSTLVRGYKVEENLSGKAIASSALKKILGAISEEKNELVNARDMAIFHLLAYGGLRRSEAANVSWNDISRDGVFFILHLPQTKSGVPQDIKLQQIVVHHLETYRQELVNCGYEASGRVFISLSRNNSHGQPLTDQSVNLIVKKYALKAGVSAKITAHMFRHTCCTLAIEGGAKPQQVQAHLRHKDLKTTMLYYENREKLTDNASDYINLE